MKFKLLISLFAFAVFFSSCKKEELSAKIIGKWKLIEVFHGYGNGGDFKWHLASSDSEVHIFDTNNQYIKIDFLGTCRGSYKILNNIELFITSNCNSSTELMKISEISTNIFIVDKQGFEGITRFKYQRIQ